MSAIWQMVAERPHWCQSRRRQHSWKLRQKLCLPIPIISGGLGAGVQPRSERARPSAGSRFMRSPAGLPHTWQRMIMAHSTPLAIGN